MFINGAFTSTYDLYRPTQSVSGSGVEKQSIPDDATSSDLPCKFVPDVVDLQAQDQGAEVIADAMMFIPYSQALYPTKKGEAPDWVFVDEKWYLVLSVKSPAGNTMFKFARLRERKTP